MAINKILKIKNKKIFDFILNDFILNDFILNNFILILFLLELYHYLNFEKAFSE
jgi:hypothetical protein